MDRCSPFKSGAKRARSKTLTRSWSRSNFAPASWSAALRRRFSTSLATFTFILTVLTALSPHAAETKKLRVVTTIFPVYCFASGVIGQQGKVQNLLPPNVEPHDYQLSPGDLRKLKDADLVIFNGAALDTWVAKALSPAEKSRSLDLAQTLSSDLIESSPDLDMDGPHQHAHERQNGRPNPHFWLDPQIAIRCVTNILARAQKLDPAHAADFAKNAEAYIASLQKLDREITEKLAPLKDQPFITQHDAFPYFVRRYQLRLVGVLETTPDTPPRPRYLADLLKVIREKNVRVIFSEPQSSPRLAKMVAHDTKINLAELDTLETGPLRPGAYEDGLHRNAATLARELKK